MEAQRKKVLVVENDEVIVTLITHILTRSSYVVHTTLDGLEADNLLERSDYDAILLDLRMPNGGVDLIRRIEARNPELLRKIIVVTAALDELPKIAGKPICAVVRKPFEVGHLLDTVRACIDPDA
ncbi:MAG TPA: response regulator [Thermoanaerobaculia bacterium]|nr:response regulator [Thermoanaerobaculia bacterium]